MAVTAEPAAETEPGPRASHPSRAALGIALAATVLTWLVAAAGWLEPLDRALADRRAALVERAPSGAVVIVGIDATSLARVGVWPWPRRIHAQLLDALRAAGAARIAYDVDFSSRSGEVDDAALVAAARRLGPERLAVPALRQLTPGGRVVESLAFPQLRAVTRAAAVTALPDPDGMIRRLPAGQRLSTGWVPSLPVWLTGVAAGAPVRIDASLPPDRLPQLSAADLLDGLVDRSALAGKLVLVGALDLTLGDRANVPGAPGIAGVQVQALAAEYLLQGRTGPVLRPAAAGVAALAAALGLVLATVAAAVRARVLLASAAGAIVAIEVVAWVLDAGDRVEPRTLALHVAIVLPLSGMLVHRWSALDRLRRGLSQRMREERAFHRRLIDLVPDGLVTVGTDGRVRSSNPAARAMLGASRDGAPLEALFGEAAPGVRDALAAPGAARLELTIAAADGSSLPAEALVAATPGHGGIAGLVLFHDITERQERARRLLEQARTDAVTGLANRVALEARLAALQRERKPHALCLIDLAGFKEINDALGLAAGDRLLHAVGRRLLAQADDDDLIARIGGDQFVWSRAGEDLAAHRARVEACVAAVSRPFVIDGSQLVVGARAGITTSPEDGCEPAALLRRCGLAVDEARRRGSDVVRFEPRHEADVERRLQIRTRLPRALERGEVEIWLQPQVDAATGRPAGVEALARWHDPVLGPVGADEFVPIAELTGSIRALTELALERALAAQAELAAHGVVLNVSVNLSPRMLGDPDLEQRLGRILASACPERRGHVVLEVTEGAFCGPLEPTVAVLERLRAAGVALALDDFGSGFSSLGRIARLPLDEVKLDRALLPRSPDDHAARRVVESTVALVRDLGRRVVAEGVEDTATASWLAAIGCDRLQGWLWAPAMPPDRLLAWARASAGAEGGPAPSARLPNLPDPTAAD